MTNELVVTEFKEMAVKFLDFTGMKNLTIQEKNQFIELCTQLKLNPFKREIYAVKYGNDFSILVGYESYLRKAEESGLLTGYSVTTSGTLKKVTKTVTRKSKYGDGKTYQQEIISWVGDPEFKATITIYKKCWDHPFVWEVDYDEYSQDNSFYATKPKTMIKKVAISQGMRMAFPSETKDLPYSYDEFTPKHVLNDSYNNGKNRLQQPKIEKPKIEFTTEKEIIPEYSDQEIKEAEAEFMQEQEDFEIVEEKQEPEFDLIDRVQNLLISERINEIIAKKLQARIETMHNSNNQAELDLLEKIIFRFERDKRYEPLTQSQLKIIKAKSIELPNGIDHARLLSKDEASKIIDQNIKGE